MDHREVLHLLDQDRRDLAHDGEVTERLPLLTRLRAANRAFHSIAYSSLQPATADEAIAGEIEHHRRLGVTFEWKLYAHDAPADLLDRLAVRGFSIGPREAVLVCDLGAQHPWIAEDGRHVVARIETTEQVAVYRRVAEEVFGDDHGPLAAALTDAIRDGSTQHRAYVACAGGEAVSVGRLHTHPRSPFAGLYGGGTLAAHQGRGFYRAVVAARARDARDAGARYLRVDALPTSRPILERLGFEWLTDIWPCEWHAPEAAATHP